jgi:hypothetical protein
MCGGDDIICVKPFMSSGSSEMHNNKSLFRSILRPEKGVIINREKRANYKKRKLLFFARSETEEKVEKIFKRNK